MATELEEIKLQVAQANRVLADVGLATGVTAALRHASRRVPSQPDWFVVKGREYVLDALAVMRAEDMVVCDTEGFLVDAPPGITQCSEVRPSGTASGTTGSVALPRTCSGDSCGALCIVLPPRNVEEECHGEEALGCLLRRDLEHAG